MMRRTFPALALAALSLLTPVATATPAPAPLLPEPGMEAEVCHGPKEDNAVCRLVVSTVFGAALAVAALLDGAACRVGSCNNLFTNTVIFVYRNLPG